MFFCGKDKYIVKIYDDVEHANSMVEIHEDLKKNNLNVPEIIKNKENKGYSVLENGQCCIIYSFLCGEEIGNIFKI